MTVLTPELVTQKLDAFGEPRHLLPLQSVPEMLRLLRPRLNKRVERVAKYSGLCESDVRAVLRSLMALKPSEPEGFE